LHIIYINQVSVKQTDTSILSQFSTYFTVFKLYVHAINKYLLNQFLQKLAIK